MKSSVILSEYHSHNNYNQTTWPTTRVLQNQDLILIWDQAQLLLIMVQVHLNLSMAQVQFLHILAPMDLVPLTMDQALSIILLLPPVLNLYFSVISLMSILQLLSMEIHQRPVNQLFM